MTNLPENTTWTCACGCGTVRTGKGHGSFHREGGSGWFWLASPEHGNRMLRTAREHAEDLTGRTEYR